MHLSFAVLLALTQPWLLAGDLHVDPFAQGTQPSAYHSDSNWPLFDSTVAAMRRAAPDARVVVISGDFLAHQWGARARAAGQDPATAAEHTMSRIAQTFAHAFPRAHFVIAMGNNDDPCGDYRTAPGTAYMASIANTWAGLVNRDGAAPDFKRSFSHAGYYSTSLPGGARALVLNDVYWSFFFSACGRGQNVGNEQLSWLAHELHAGSRSVLVMHIPPGVDPTSTLIAHRFLIVPYWHGEFRDRFERLTVDYRDAIAFEIAGHTHRLDFRIPGGNAMIVAPAISSIYYNNPSFLRLNVDAGARVEDYNEFAYDPDTGIWSNAFDFESAFGVDGVSARSFQHVHEVIGANEDVRDRWAGAMVGGAASARDISAAWKAFWCAQTETAGGYARCAGDQRRTAVLPVVLTLAGVVVALLIVWYSRRRPWTAPRKNV